MIDNRVKFRHLQTFVEVARQKSVMKAAELLHVSQPAVTKTIRELEEVLGVAVFEKDGRGIRITRYGEAFLKHRASIPFPMPYMPMHRPSGLVPCRRCPPGSFRRP